MENNGKRQTPNADTLNRIRMMNDTELIRAIDVVAGAIGMNPMQAQKAKNNIQTIRKKLNTASEKDLDKAIRSIGKDSAEEIKRKLGL